MNQPQRERGISVVCPFCVIQSTKLQPCWSEGTIWAVLINPAASLSCDLKQYLINLNFCKELKGNNLFV